jgi:hypothetical protein
MSSSLHSSVPRWELPEKQFNAAEIFLVFVDSGNVIAGQILTTSNDWPCFSHGGYGRVNEIAPMAKALMGALTAMLTGVVRAGSP